MPENSSLKAQILLTHFPVFTFEFKQFFHVDVVGFYFGD